MDWEYILINKLHFLLFAVGIIGLVAVEYCMYLTLKIITNTSTSNSVKKISNTIDKLDECVHNIQTKIKEIRKDMH